MKKNKQGAPKSLPKVSSEDSRKQPRLKPVPKTKNWKNSIFDEEDFYDETDNPEPGDYIAEDDRFEDDPET